MMEDETVSGSVWDKIITKVYEIKMGPRDNEVIMQIWECQKDAPVTLNLVRRIIKMFISYKSPSTKQNSGNGSDEGYQQHKNSSHKPKKPSCSFRLLKIFAYHNKTISICKISDTPNEKPDRHNEGQNIEKYCLSFVLHDDMVRDKKQEETEGDPKQKQKHANSDPQSPVLHSKVLSNVPLGRASNVGNNIQKISYDDESVSNPKQGHFAFVLLRSLLWVIVIQLETDRVVKIIPVNIPLIAHTCLRCCLVTAQVLHEF